jgi:predicted phage tail component-like protein
MSNSFFWKDRYSEDLGIIVESLPPIVKPPLKYEVVEIDGRDGDITNILGYKSYIKTFNIAFINNTGEDDFYYVDEVASWLSGESKIIFSNEWDKYYNGIILDQINYEKVIKYRKASINIKVQPFKYSTDEKTVIKTSNFDFYNMSMLDTLPIITITGSGLVHLLINNEEICQVNINERITLDSVLQEAYKDSINNLANRNMFGDFPMFKNGKNIVSWYGEGTVTQVEVKYRWRWL